jgi:hypothetical protein
MVFIKTFTSMLPNYSRPNLTIPLPHDQFSAVIEFSFPQLP